VDDRAFLLDTMVFSALSVRDRRELRQLYRPHVEGRRIVLSVQTVAEVRFGALDAGWGEQRRRELEERIAKVTMAAITDHVISVYARLKQQLKAAGHGLGQKIHDGDRWIAATAVANELPLVTHDRAFQDVEGLKLITETPDAT
jgi:predicted nucleic acid-binding protein